MKKPTSCIFKFIAHSKDTEEASGSNGDNVTPTGAKKKKGKLIQSIYLKRNQFDDDRYIQHRYSCCNASKNSVFRETKVRLGKRCFTAQKSTN